MIYLIRSFTEDYSVIVVRPCKNERMKVSAN